MTKRILWIVVPIVCVLALVVWRIVTHNQANAQLKGGAGGRGGRNRTPTVQVAKAGPALIESTLQAVGNVESPFKVDMSPKTSGKIEFLQVREGDKVTPGEVLVKIDPTEIQGQILQSQAAVAEAQSRLAQAAVGEGANTVSIVSQIEQQKAGVSSANADLLQTERNYDATVATARSAVVDAKAKVAAAKAQVDNAKASQQREEANLNNAQVKLDRITSLYQQGFVAAQDVDDAKTAYQVEVGAVNVAKAQVNAAQQGVASANAQLSSANSNLTIVSRKGISDIAASKAKATQAVASLSLARANRSQEPAYKQNLAALQSTVAAARAELNQAQARLADTVLRSPIKGTVTARNEDPGDLATPSQPVLTVQYLDWLYVVSSLPTETSQSIYVGQPVQVTFDAIPNKVFVGKILNVNPAADPQSRQYMIRTKLANPNHALRPGMFGHLSIVSERVHASVAVPKEAVETTDGKSTVTVIGDDMKADVRPVVLGASNDKTVQILSGVRPGENVVVLSYGSLKPGQAVTLPGAGGGQGGRGRAGGGQGNGRGGRGRPGAGGPTG